MGLIKKVKVKISTWRMFSRERNVRIYRRMFSLRYLRNKDLFLIKSAALELRILIFNQQHCHQLLAQPKSSQ